MGFFDNLKKEAGSQWIEIIQWLDDSADTLVYRFPVYNQEIKMGAQLVVRENQNALFLNEGQVADLFTPGTYTLSTQNMPVMSVLRGWKYGFQSPFKAEVYFFNMRMFTDLKWGTANPVMMRDKDFGAIRIRAFGTYATRVVDPKAFFKAVVGTQSQTSTADILGQLRSTILSRLTDAIASANIAALDLAANYDEIAKSAIATVGPEFTSYGLELSKFYVENISLPEEVEAALDQRSRIGILGDKMGQYTQMQAADAISVAAANPGGFAGAGAGLGAGMAIGNAMGGAFGAAGASQMPPQAPSAAPPPPSAAAAASTARWSIAIDGKTYGPYTDDALKNMLASGQVTAQTNAWRPGCAGWAPVSEFSELGGSMMPPPPPPPAK
jgi:membrane protease subunit (stomatin/prohibitin family)